MGFGGKAGFRHLDHQVKLQVEAQDKQAHQQHTKQRQALCDWTRSYLLLVRFGVSLSLGARIK